MFAALPTRIVPDPFINLADNPDGGDPSPTSTLVRPITPGFTERLVNVPEEARPRSLGLICEVELKNRSPMKAQAAEFWRKFATLVSASRYCVVAVSRSCRLAAPISTSFTVRR